jgi:hypothetical protein
MLELCSAHPPIAVLINLAHDLPQLPWLHVHAKQNEPLMQFNRRYHAITITVESI